MEKLDLAQKYKRYYTAANKPEVIEIEDARFLSVKGKGDPSGEGFTEKIKALYSTAYTLKFLYKAKGKDFVVAKLEGLWWFDEQSYGALSLQRRR